MQLLRHGDVLPSQPQVDGTIVRMGATWISEQANKYWSN